MDRGDPDDGAQDTGALTHARAAMVRDQLIARGIADLAVLRAMGSIPRERFVPEAEAAQAYLDGAQAIGHGQTISQPWIVARMTEVLDLPGWRARHPGPAPAVLDVGTGSGYQAAVLAAIGARVTTIERDPALSARAAGVLSGLGYHVHAVVGDGSDGYAPDAPYAGIIVGAAAPAIPLPLLAQLAPGGRLVLPVGPRGLQELVVAWMEDGEVRTAALGGCVFVPLIGRHGQPGMSDD
ncbi:MAG: protein-L-isoaspartate(D-aspartate) O-methyltransferase [Chloroflexota bacterium]